MEYTTEEERLIGLRAEWLRREYEATGFVTYLRLAEILEEAKNEKMVWENLGKRSSSITCGLKKMNGLSSFL